MIWSKKGQVEMVGLVFIVLFIVVVGAVFLFILAGDNTTAFDRSDFTASKLTDKFIGTIVEVEIEECGSKPIKQLVREDFEGQDFCGKDLAGNSVNTLEYLNNTILPRILEDTFTAQGIDYEFKIIGDAGADYLFLSSDSAACDLTTNSIIRESRTFIPYGDFIQNIEFYICVGTN